MPESHTAPALSRLCGIFFPLDHNGIECTDCSEVNRMFSCGEIAIYLFVNFKSNFSYFGYDPYL